MAANAKSQVFFWLMVVVIVGAVGGVMFLGQQQGVMSGRPDISGGPRTDAPMGVYTRYFEKKSAKVPSGVVNLDLTYHWYAPSKPWPQGIKFPLVMVLHGAPGNAYAAQYLLQREMLINFPAFVFVPVLPWGMTWYEPSSSPQGNDYDKQRPKGLPGAMAVLEKIMQEYPVDTSRIYVIGCSEGGTGAFGAVKEYGDKIAASVAISGGWAPQHAAYFKKTPMLVMHGAVDSVIPVVRSRDVSVAARRLGAPLDYIEFPGMDHNCPAPQLYGPTVWRWMFSKKKPPAPQPQ